MCGLVSVWWRFFIRVSVLLVMFDFLDVVDI